MWLSLQPLASNQVRQRYSVSSTPLRTVWGGVVCKGYAASITFSSSSLHFSSESFAPRTMLVDPASLPAELETSAVQPVCYCCCVQ